MRYVPGARLDDGERIVSVPEVPGSGRHRHGAQRHPVLREVPEDTAAAHEARSDPVSR